MTAKGEFRWEGICLSDDPFAGDYGGAGGGDRVLSDKMVTNRKGGVCHMCAGECALGTRNRVRAEIYDGELMRFRWCVECCFAMAAYYLGRFSLADRLCSLGDERRKAQAIEARQGGDAKQAPSQDESAVRKDAP